MNTRRASPLAKTGPAPRGCLDEVEALAFAEGRLGASPEILGHMDECAACRELVSVLASDPDVCQTTLSDQPAPPTSLLPPAPDPDVLKAGDDLDGRFHVLALLRRGAMGSVYRAHDN